MVKESHRKVTDEIEQLRVLLDQKWNCGFLEGEIKAKRDTLLQLLAHVGFEVTGEYLDRIQACADVGSLERWTKNIFRAKTMADVVA